jgi:hypothetical protein
MSGSSASVAVASQRPSCADLNPGSEEVVAGFVEPAVAEARVGEAMQLEGSGTSAWTPTPQRVTQCSTGP